MYNKRMTVELKVKADNREKKMKKNIRTTATPLRRKKKVRYNWRTGKRKLGADFMRPSRTWVSAQNVTANDCIC